MNIILTNDYLAKSKKVTEDGTIRVFIQSTSDAVPTVRVEFTPHEQTLVTP